MLRYVIVFLVFFCLASNGVAQTSSYFPDIAHYPLTQALTLLGAVLVSGIVGWLLRGAKYQFDKKEVDNEWRGKIRGLKNQITKLENEIAKLENDKKASGHEQAMSITSTSAKQNENIKAMDEPTQKSSYSNQPTWATVVEPTSHSIAERPLIPKAEEVARPELVVTYFYAPVLESNSIPENQLTPDAMSHLPIMLLIKSSNDKHAEFTLNPSVNQARIIGNGLNQLRAFFDFDLPPGNFSSVSPAAPGKFEKVNGSWVVCVKAKLDVR